MKLVIEDEAGTRSVLPFSTAELTVGRAQEGNRFRLPDRDVSRRHARFLLVNGVPFVEDLGSLTGTRVNGERITARRRLREGDLVEIGSYDLAVVPDDGLAAVAGPGAPPPLPGPAPAPPPAARPAAPPIAAVVADEERAPVAEEPPRRGLLLAYVAAFLVALVLGAAVGALTMR
ncbi:MAG TPA: FHA domain-containing protein [Anaeromyxobacter sp.]|nr:FHA domain-containing protein [Anaeromyxobacter sp.]